MNFKLINNLSNTDNHSTRLKALFEIADDIIVTSPFLMMDFADFLGEVNLSAVKKFHLITTLPPKSFDQFGKISSLISLIEFPVVKDGRVDCQISLNNKLHGKIYIFKKSGSYIAAIISSANFTGSGLSRNHEWGVEISDSTEIENLENSILGTIEIRSLSFDEIYRMQQLANEFLIAQPQIEERKIDLNLVEMFFSSSWTSLLDNTIDYWLKPIGVSTNPVPETRLFDINERLHFSKLRPNGVKPNDILIAYGVGTTKILSVYRTTSFPIISTAEEIEDDDWLERWPWYVETTNLTPNFGGTWSTHNLFIGSLMQTFLSLNPTEAITAVGGQTLGALNFGKDKVKLAPNFARYIIDQVAAINDGR